MARGDIPSEADPLADVLRRVGMAVFDGKVRVARAVADPKTDKDLPPPGVLSWSGIKSTTGVGGTTGSDCKLVHGDRWQQIEGDHTEKINSNVKTTILANQTHTVMGNQDRTITGNINHSVLGNVCTTILGAELRCNMGVQNLSHVAPKTRLHAGEEMTSESGAFMRWINNHFEAHGFRTEVMGSYNLICGLFLFMALWEMEIVNAHTEVKVGKNGGVALHMETGGFKQHIRALTNYIAGIRLAIAINTAEIQTRAQVPPESIPGIE